MKIESNYVYLKGIHFLHAANKAQTGMLDIKARNVWVEDCIFERSNGTGISFMDLMSSEETNIRLLNCEIKDNGHVGFHGEGIYGLRMEDCVVSGNNAKNFNNDWESGGGKFLMSRKLVFASSVFSKNKGPGIWIDFGNEDVEVKNCLLMENGTTGLYYEASYKLRAHDNVVVGNSYVGIGPALSIDCLIERNLMVGNGEVGFKHTNGSRGVYRLDTPEISTDKNPSHWIPADQGVYWIWNAEHIVRNNIFAYNAGQISGWLDVTLTPYQWPSSLDVQMQVFIAEQRDSMQLRHKNNFFVQTTPSTNLFSGVFTGQNRTFYTLETLWQVRPDLEAGSRVGQIAFANRNALDFRVPANSEAVQMGCYPQGEVPGVRLGIMDPDGVKTIQTGQYQVYPTFVKDNLTIIGAENAAISLVNTSGIVLYSTNKAKDTESVFMGNYPVGMYFVKINGSTTKIIKK
jgi:hypothetical protein